MRNLLTSIITYEIKLANVSVVMLGFLIIPIQSAISYFIHPPLVLFFNEIFIVLLLHEAGHLIAMKYYSYQSLRLQFFGLFAWVEGYNENENQKSYLVVLLAGGLSGILAGIVLYFIAVYLQNSFLITLAKLFIYLNGFNLLPFLPLDGGKFLQNLFFPDNNYPRLVLIGVSFLGYIGIMVIFHVWSLSILIAIFMLVYYREFKDAIRYNYWFENSTEMDLNVDIYLKILFACVWIILIVASIFILFYHNTQI